MKGNIFWSGFLVVLSLHTVTCQWRNPFLNILDQFNFNHNRRHQSPVNNWRDNRNGRLIQQPQVGAKLTCKTSDGFIGNCLPIASCFYQFASIELVYENRCPVTVNGFRTNGVCCPPRDYQRAGDDIIPFTLNPPPWPRVQLPIDKSQISRAVDQTENVILRFLAMELNFIRLGYEQQFNTMAAIHQSVFGPPDQTLQALNLNGFRALEVTRMLGKRFGLSPLQIRDGLSQLNLFNTPYERYCLPVPPCSAGYKYRTIDGSCNNLNHPLWGKSNTQYSRILPPAYSDGISEFRIAVSGRPLPLARYVSTELTQTSQRLDPQLNVMFMQWGQILDHDLTLGSSTRATTGQGLLCCNRTHLEDPVFHPACRPIIIPRRDPFYQKFNHHCNNFVRNAVGPKNNCNLGYREQTNVITAFIDGSMIYGNQRNRSRLVRQFQDGLLKVARIDGREWLPYDRMNNSLACSIPRNMAIRNAEKHCIFSGDVRVNQQVGITTLQLLLLREHNRIARQLRRINRHWNDEILFQEARRIVGAQIQHITYNEWLPLALGRSVMKATGLLLSPVGHCNSYNPNINPSILNEFASSAFRWHSLVQRFYQLMSTNGQVKGRFPMHRVFNNPSLLYRNGAVDEALYGLLAQKSEQFDSVFVEDIKNLLFPAPNAQFGLDLISINIQRGRDHGIPPYNEIRSACGLRPVRNFRQLESILLPRMARKFAVVYDHVDDIDFFVAGINEIPLPEGIVGPTFSCIVSEQFRRVKYGDRFWYENGGMAHSFTEKQLTEIRKVSLAGIICANGDNIHKMQPFAMLIKSNLNSHVDCKQIPQIDLSHWRNERVW